MSVGTVGIVLGSGFGAFAEAIERRKETQYADIQGWPLSTAVGHAGRMIQGEIASTRVIVLAGRAHLYEGYPAAQIVFGIRQLVKCGVKSVILTNAAGGINLSYEPGELVLISDHINLTGANPLIGPNDESLGPRFPDMTEIYTPSCREIARRAATSLGWKVKEGVYAGLVGPSYETPAEIRYLRAIGADLVGMSTVLEAIAAAHAGVKVLGISCVTNMASGVRPEKLVHRDVLAVGEKIRDRMTHLLTAVTPQLA